MSRMKSLEPVAREESSFFSLPVAGTLCTVLSALSFLFVCMILPIVGKAGVATVHVGENTVAFAAALLVTLVLSMLATASQLMRRRQDNSPLPFFSLTLCALSALLLLALALGLLRI